MKFSTPVTDFGQPFAITPQDNILVLGSCFAQVVGKRLTTYRLNATFNPFGTIYNPQSICNIIGAACTVISNPQAATDIAMQTMLQANDGFYYSWLAASAIKGHTQGEYINAMTAALHKLAEQITELDVLIITLGTNRHYIYQPTGQSVANCHKVSGKLFAEQSLQPQEIASMLQHMQNQLTALRPQLKIIVSVSPYRYLKYGHHGSQLSKAALLLGVEQWMQYCSNVHYFPAYEILLDELRDYRYYAPDMQHPSEVAEEYIWSLFHDNYLAPDTQQHIKELIPVLKAQAHITR